VHTYNNIGTYLVRLIAIDSTTCNISDTVYKHIIVRNDRAYLDFTAIKQQPCESLSYKFVNNSIPPVGKPFTDSSFVWDFGDGSPRVVTGTGDLTHSFAAAGTYKVRLVLIDTNYCNYPDSSVLSLSVSPLVKARFITPEVGCVPYNANFNNTSLGGQQFFWDFGDGGTSTVANPTHFYPTIGSYTVSLKVIDSNTCNIVDSTSTTITISGRPKALFTTTPVPPQPNTLTVFYNNSTGGVLYKWLFGDGDSVVKANTDTVGHQYNQTGTFNACLIVYNKNFCTDTFCLPVETIVNPLLDIPNAFTPGRFGENGVVRVRGFGIAKMMFRIYNRWGQKVFESTNPTIGWDGTFNGVPQDMGTYDYRIILSDPNGKLKYFKGSVILIR